MLLPVSVATIVMVLGVPAVKLIGLDAAPVTTVTPSIVIVPDPVGVTVMLETPLATVTPE